MSIFSKTSDIARGMLGGGTNKNDVKLAKLELKKAKVENKTKNGNIEAVINYSKLNYEQIERIINDLKQECIVLKDQVEKQDDGEAVLNAKNKLSYLYLSKDYFSLLSKYVAGVGLSKQQVKLITKFAPFFDGKQVLDSNDGSEEDDSLAGELKDMGNEFKDMGNELKMAFVGSSLFSLDGYLQENYEEQIDNLIIPDIDAAMSLFARAVNLNDTKRQDSPSVIENANGNIDDNLVECSNCHEKFSKQNKFCPNCGSRREQPKPSFCEECGAPLNPNSKFCGNCGKKIVI